MFNKPQGHGFVTAVSIVVVCQKSMCGSIAADTQHTEGTQWVMLIQVSKPYVQQYSDPHVRNDQSGDYDGGN